ncbi:hypothetical protein AKO1_013454 [Acrasis kona]|uniref:Uncharacterized protein n=1 Tax=Acrasis kona TaxID=1008807 RepID=A0AAW2ZJJ4_9EUKA
MEEVIQAQLDELIKLQDQERQNLIEEEHSNLELEILIKNKNEQKNNILENIRKIEFNILEAQVNVDKARQENNHQNQKLIDLKKSKVENQSKIKKLQEYHSNLIKLMEEERNSCESYKKEVTDYMMNQSTCGLDHQELQSKRQRISQELLKTQQEIEQITLTNSECEDRSNSIRHQIQDINQHIEQVQSENVEFIDEVKDIKGQIKQMEELIKQKTNHLDKSKSEQQQLLLDHNNIVSQVKEQQNRRTALERTLTQRRIQLAKQSEQLRSK